MKLFNCRCGHRVFFENIRCEACNSQLGFDPKSLEMISIDWISDHYEDSSGSAYRCCKNQIEFNNCNWLQRADAPEEYCWSCQLNRTIPNLSSPPNRGRWLSLEQAKRRLVYSLLTHDLPVRSRIQGWPDGLAFDFVEDQRSNPNVSEQFVGTGHQNGVITINVAEADDLFRLRMRLSVGEFYRTVLGHFRHESGHYYYHILVEDESLDAFQNKFGDAAQDYATALAAYYKNGPSQAWNSQFISAYASAHPLEDWAETWAHYLLIKDSIETACVEGLVKSSMYFEQALQTWIDTAIKVNQINQDLGLDHPYPFVITDPVRDKLIFIDRLLAARPARQASNPNGNPKSEMQKSAVLSPSHQPADDNKSPP